MANPNDNLPCPCSHSQFTKCALFNFAKTAIGHFQGLYDNSRRSREETFSNYFPHRFLERSLCPSKLADKEASRSESGRRRHISFRARANVLQAKSVLRYSNINSVRKCTHITRGWPYDGRN